MHGPKRVLAHNRILWVGEVTACRSHHLLITMGSSGRVEHTLTSDLEVRDGRNPGYHGGENRPHFPRKSGFRESFTAFEREIQCADYLPVSFVATLRHSGTLTACMRYTAPISEYPLHLTFTRLPPDSSIRQRCLRALRKAGGETVLLPTSYRFHPKSKNKMRCRTQLVDSWMFGKRNSKTTQLAPPFSHMHSWANDTPCNPQRFYKEVLVTKQVKNDNVQVLDGFKLRIVSEWMERGNTHSHTHLRNNEVTDRTEPVSPRPHTQYPISDSLEYSCSA